jgi:hypothetical protein
MAFTVFTTYTLAATDGYSRAIHCNYIKRIVLNTDTPDIMQLNMSFPYGEDFKFLNPNLATGIGYSANKLYAIVQIVSGTGTTVNPDPSLWYTYDVTDQIIGYVAGAPLTASGLTGTSFVVNLNTYYLANSNPLKKFKPYNLLYLNYPSVSANDELCFGDEVYFLGNVTTEIHADVYTTDISILLPLNQFNSTTNPTWDGVSKVSISEIGIYDANKNLVAIGKLNDPIDKDSTISRTLQFALDF